MTDATLLNWVELTVIGIELLAVFILVMAIVIATARYFFRILFRKQMKGLYKSYRRGLAQAILMGLEILIAADVIQTVALDRTIQAVVVLGLLVTIRIILSWSLMVEIDNRWPWQQKANAPSEDDDI